MYDFSIFIGPYIDDNSRLLARFFHATGMCAAGKKSSFIDLRQREKEHLVVALTSVEFETASTAVAVDTYGTWNIHDAFAACAGLMLRICARRVVRVYLPSTLVIWNSVTRVTSSEYCGANVFIYFRVVEISGGKFQLHPRDIADEVF